MAGVSVLLALSLLTLSSSLALAHPMSSKFREDPEVHYNAVSTELL